MNEVTLSYTPDAGRVGTGTGQGSVAGTYTYDIYQYAVDGQNLTFLLAKDMNYQVL